MKAKATDSNLVENLYLKSDFTEFFKNNRESKSLQFPRCVDVTSDSFGEKKLNLSPTLILMTSLELQRKLDSKLLSFINTIIHFILYTEKIGKVRFF